MISQNDPINATEAILSRTLHIFVDMQGHTYEKKIIANRLYGISLEEASKYMTACLQKEEKILNTFFKKFEEIEKNYHQCGITHTRIALCHAQVSAMIDSIAEHILKDIIDLEEICDAKALMEKMALKRMEDLSDDHILVKQFWEVFEYINNSTANSNFTLNHHKHNELTVAINLNEVYKAAARNYQSLHDINEMRTLLRSSKKYRFIEMNKQVRTNSFPVDEFKQVKTDVAVERNVKCWIFSNPYQYKN